MVPGTAHPVVLEAAPEVAVFDVAPPRVRASPVATSEPPDYTGAPPNASKTPAAAPTADDEVTSASREPPVQSDLYVYTDGAFPTELPPTRWAVHAPVPAFEGSPVPPTRLSPAVRAAWSEALAELEERNAKRVGATVAAGVGGGLIIGGAVAASMLGCSLQ